MNQILVTEKLYVTPDMKKKKNLFKIEFVISVFLMCLLSSYAIYGYYDRSKNEHVSQEILADMEFTPANTTKLVKTDAIVVALSGEQRKARNTEQLVEQVVEIPKEQTTMINGTAYSTIGQINIPSIGVNYPVLADWSDALLKVSPCKFIRTESK
ncbi:MAG: hypothetical protein FWC53_02175 [Firmicutes bacterium]|nr:hypothetical protein [Bacillota bacterium]